jgi:hypothetical protein
MTGIENKPFVLMLNAGWQRVGYKTVAEGIADLCAGINSKAVEISYRLDENGMPIYDDFDYIRDNLRTYTWEEWIELPIRPWDMSIKSVKMEVRIPTVLVAQNFAAMPKKSFKGKPSKESVWIRDRGVCQYTGIKLDKDDATVDHVLPKDKGGKDEWENVALTSRKLNNTKGNKLNSEMGLRLIKPPKAPLPVPLSALIREPKHPDWAYFIDR